MPTPWRLLNPESAPTLDGSACTPIDDHRLFVGGGHKHYTAVSTCGYYDARTQEWKPLPDLPAARFGCRAVCVNEKVYVMGGTGGVMPGVASEITELVSFSLSGDDPAEYLQRDWDTSLAPIGEGRTFFASVVLSNEIYVFGGRSFTDGVTNSAQKYDIYTDQWTQLPSMPSGRIRCGAAVVGNKIYVVGGTASNERVDKLASTFVFDTSNQQWTKEIPDMKFPRSSFLVVAVDHFIVAVGDYTSCCAMEILDTQLKVWIEGPQMNCALGGIGGFLSETREIIVRGYLRGFTRTAEEDRIVWGSIQFENGLQPGGKIQSHTAGGRNDETKNSNDQLGYDVYADALVNVVQTIEISGGSNFAVGLMASWGVGKTKLWYLIKEKIKEADNVLRDDEVPYRPPLFGAPPFMSDDFRKIYRRVDSWRCFTKANEGNQVICEKKCDTVAALVISFFPFFFAYECIDQYRTDKTSIFHWGRYHPLLKSILSFLGDVTEWGTGHCCKQSHKFIFFLSFFVYCLILAILATFSAVILFVPFLGVVVYIFFNTSRQEKETVDTTKDNLVPLTTREVWNRLHGYNLSPIKVLARASSFSIPVVLRLLILIVYWMVLKIVQSCIVSLFYIRSFCFGRSMPKRFKAHDQPEIHHKKHIFVDFNAWVYNGSDVLWASLMLEMLAAVKAEYPKYTYELYKLKSKLAMHSIEPEDDASKKKEKFEKAFVRYCTKLTFLITLSFGFVAVGIYFLIENDINIFNTAILFLSGLLALVKVASMFALTVIPSFCVNPTERVLRKVINSSRTQGHDFSMHAGLMGEVKKEMESLSDFLQTEPVMHMGVLRKPHLSISVDDLDRCNPQTIVQVLRAVSLLLEGGGEMTCWLAIDPQIVVSAIDDDSGEYLRNAGVDGADFLDKIFQLPFCIPHMTKNYKDNLMARMSIPNSSALVEVELAFRALQHKFVEVNMARSPGSLTKNEQEDLQQSYEVFSGWKGSFSETAELIVFLKQTDWAKTRNLDKQDGTEVRSIAMEYIQHLRSIQVKCSIALECYQHENSSRTTGKQYTASNATKGSDELGIKDLELGDVVNTVDLLPVHMAVLSSDDERNYRAVEQGSLVDAGDENNIEGGATTAPMNDVVAEGIDEASGEGAITDLNRITSSNEGIISNIGKKASKVGDIVCEEAVANYHNSDGNDDEIAAGGYGESSGAGLSFARGTASKRFGIENVSGGGDRTGPNPEEFAIHRNANTSDDDDGSGGGDDIFVVNYEGILSAEEWHWVKDMSKYFPRKGRKLKKIFNIYNVSRFVIEKRMNLKGNYDRMFRRKMIKAIVLAEIWPQKTAWILQVAEYAMVAEKRFERKLAEKCVAREGEMQLNELVRKLHQLYFGEKMRNGKPTIESIFEDIPLAVVYRAIVEPLMKSAPEPRFLSSQHDEVEAFECLLEDSDENLRDNLTLSDIRPLDYEERFERTKPSLRPFLFNMQNYHLQRASFDMSQIIIHCDDFDTATSLNIKWERKLDCYTKKPVHLLDVSTPLVPTGKQLINTTQASLPSQQTNDVDTPASSSNASSRSINEDRTRAPGLSKEQQQIQNQQAMIQSLLQMVQNQ